MNFLILSAGTRNKIVQYFKKELNGKGLVVATDCSKLAPAIYEADKYYIVPRIDDKDYLNCILDICIKEKINGLISLIDPELSLISENIVKFKEIGVTPIISEHKNVEMCFNKYKMYQFLVENGIRTAKTYIDKNEFYKDLEKENMKFPVFVKPIEGSASININKVYNRDELELLWKKENNLLIQQFMDGEEFGADVYIDMISNEISAIFTKKKIKMRAGETDKSVSIKDEKLFSIIKGFVKKAEFKGIIDIDIFKVNGEYYISEVNPRFGGGYPHAYESKVNIPKMIINNLEGKINNEQIGDYEEDIYMMKYNEVKIVHL